MVAAFAWYYNAGQGTYYWTESYTMSTFQFAREVSRLTGESLSESDISEAHRQADLDAIKRRARNIIYVP